MEVVEVIPEKKHRFRVVFEDSSVFVLYRSDISKYHISEHVNISEEDYKEIVTNLLVKRAVNRIAYLLERKDYTIYQILTKLRMAGYPDESANKAVEKMQLLGYLDDYRFALRYLECHAKSESMNGMVQELRQKGISSDVIKSAKETIMSEDNQPDEKKIVRDILRKRHYYEKEPNDKEKAKQFAYLMRKGFAANVIRYELSNFSEYAENI